MQFSVKYLCVVTAFSQKGKIFMSQNYGNLLYRQGPCGGSGGSLSFDYGIQFDLRTAIITNITLYTGKYFSYTVLSGLSVSYVDSNQNSFGKYFGTVTDQKSTLLLKSDEYITGVYGVVGSVVDYLQITTNKGRSCSAGIKSSNKSFSFTAPTAFEGAQSSAIDAQFAIVNFFGWYGSVIDSLGIDFRKIG